MPATSQLPGVVQKVGFAEGTKSRVFSAGFGGAGRSNDYSLRTSRGIVGGTHRCGPPNEYCWGFVPHFRGDVSCIALAIWWSQKSRKLVST
jgi:hypothetical protein